MSRNTIGNHFILTCFGESHGQCIGAVIDGCPPGIPLSVQDVQIEVDKRRPISGRISTPRKEKDRVELLSGIFNGYTTGAPICTLVWNRDVDSHVYDEFRWKPRPGHADFPALIRYRRFNDYRGGGRFSGRMTLAIVMAGAIAKKILNTFHIEVLSHSIEIGGVKAKGAPTIDQIRTNTYRNVVRCADLRTARIMHKAVLDVREEGDSVGGIVECIVSKFPPGIGDPIFDSLDADLAKMLFAIPAVKGVEFGAGFNASRLKESKNNDQYCIHGEKITTVTNNAGGILGGLSNGMPIVIRVGFKPTPSISKKQQTVDLQKHEETTIEIRGRHDACIVPRAVPVVEAATAIVLVDQLLRYRYDALRETTDE